MNICLSIGVAVSVAWRWHVPSQASAFIGLLSQAIWLPCFCPALFKNLHRYRLWLRRGCERANDQYLPAPSLYCVSESLDGNIMAVCFGVVALVALTPLIAIQIMGLVFTMARRQGCANAALTIDELNEIEEWEDTERMHNKPAFKCWHDYRFKDRKKAHAIFEAEKHPSTIYVSEKERRQNEVMDYLGLAPPKSDFHVSCLKKGVPGLLSALGKGLCLHKPNRGCAFTSLYSGASSYITKILDSEMQDKI